MFKKKEKKKLYEKTFSFSYEVEFIDGGKELRTGCITAIHIENALDRASMWIQERVECDDLIEGATLIRIEREEG